MLRGWLDDFLVAHPQLSLELSIGDTLADLYRSNVDLAVRVGWLEDSGLVRRQLALTRRVAVAAPAYLARCGTPASPEALAQHQMLCLAPGGQARMRWPFRSRQSRLEVEANGRRTSDDGAVVRDWALAGHGIAFKSWFDVAADVSAGRLVLLFPEWYQDSVPLQLVFLQSRFPSYRQRRLIEFLQARFAAFDADYPFPG
ncbi:substrate binding domain-containing protein [Cupriavidus basilensis]|nr:substrate binding domain-containing protein [Cupriavidus basilensis]